MTDPIFRDQSTPEEVPTNYISNPVRVQLPKYDDRLEGRRWTQMDLVALANNILDRETECADLRKRVGALTIQVSDMKSAIEELQSIVVNVRDTRSNAVGGKLGRIFAAIEKILSEDDDEDDDDLY